MSDREALKVFARQPVSQEMVEHLVSTTKSIIQVKSQKTTNTVNCAGNTWSVTPKVISLTQFINNLIKYSNVQTPTLMASLIYLNKLRSILPANAVGMETTRHRIFLSALILSAKTLNDSSPLNKHWAKYTDGLLTIDEVNMAERELIGLLKWNISINQQDLIHVLQPFLKDIKLQLLERQELESARKTDFYRLTNSYTKIRVPSSQTLSSGSISSMASSTLSLKSAGSSYSISEEEDDNNSYNHYKRRPLISLSSSSLNRQLTSEKSINLQQSHQNRVLA